MVPVALATQALTWSQVDQTLKPHIAAKGYDWEYHGVETDRQLWKIQGQTPPDKDSEAEKVWRNENRPIPYY